MKLLQIKVIVQPIGKEVVQQSLHHLTIQCAHKEKHLDSTALIMPALMLELVAHLSM